MRDSKKVLCFILCLVMILNVFTFTVFAADTAYTVTAKEYSSGTLEGGSTSYSTAYLPLSKLSSPAVEDITLTEPNTGSYFIGSAEVTGSAFVFTGSALVVATGESVTLPSTCAFADIKIDVFGTLTLEKDSYTGEITVYEWADEEGYGIVNAYANNTSIIIGASTGGGSVVVSGTGIKIKGAFASVDCKEKSSTEHYEVTLDDATTIHDGTSFISYTYGKTLTATNDAVVHIASGAASTIYLNRSATLYVDKSNPDMEVIGSSGDNKLIVNDDDAATNVNSKVKIKGTFGYVYTEFAYRYSDKSDDVEYVSLTGTTTVGAVGGSKSLISIDNTNGHTLTLEDGATAYLYDDDCGSTINVYDATLYVRANQTNGTIVGQTVNSNAAAEVYVQINSGSIKANIKGEFATVDTTQNFVNSNSDDTKSSVVLAGDTTIHKGRAHINSKQYNINVYGNGDTTSEYDIVGEEVENKRSTITVGKEGEEDVEAYVHGQIDLAKLIAGDLNFDYECTDLRRGSYSTTSTTSSWHTYVQGDTLEDGIGGNLYWNRPTVGVETYTFTAIQAIVAGKFNSIETEEFNDHDGVSLVGDTQIVQGENYINSNLVYFYNWGNWDSNPTTSRAIYYYSDANDSFYYYGSYDLILGSKDINDHGYETATILTLGYDLGASEEHPHADYADLGSLKIYSGATANVSGIFGVNYNNLAAEEDVHLFAYAGHSFIIEDGIYGAKWENATGTDLNVGGTLNVSMGTHDDVVYAKHYLGSGDYLMPLEDVPDVITPKVSGFFKSITGTVNQGEDTIIYNGSNDIYVDDGERTLSGSYEDVYVGTKTIWNYITDSEIDYPLYEFDEPEYEEIIKFYKNEYTWPTYVTFSGIANTITVTSGCVTIDGKVEAITVNGGLVRLVEGGLAKNVIVNGGMFFLDGGKVENKQVAEAEYKAVDVKQNAWFVMESGEITLRPSTEFCNETKFTAVENAGTSFLRNGKITISDGKDNKGICNHNLLTVGVYDEEVGENAKVEITLDNGTGIYNAASLANTNIYDVDITVKNNGSFNNGIGIDAEYGQLYILSGDDTIDDTEVDCDGDGEAETYIVNDAAPVPTVIVTVDDGKSGTALKVGNGVTWAVAGLYQTSQFKAAVALDTRSKQTADEAFLYDYDSAYEILDFDLLQFVIDYWSEEELFGEDLYIEDFEKNVKDAIVSEADTAKLAGYPITCGKYIGAINCTNCVFDELFPGTIQNSKNKLDKNFYVVENAGAKTVVDAEWQLRLAMENTSDVIPDTYVMPIDVTLGLFEDCHGMCDLEEINISDGIKTLDLNGFVLTNKAVADTIVITGSGDLTIRAGSKNGGKIESSNSTVYDSVYVNGGKLTVEEGSNAFIEKLHVKDSTKVLVKGGVYSEVYVDDDTPVYSILPNNLDWYNLKTKETYVRDCYLAEYRSALRMDGATYTVTPITHKITLDKTILNQTTGDVALTATVSPAKTKLTWEVTSGDAKFADSSTKIVRDANSTTDKVTLKACAVKSVVTVSNEYGDIKTFTLDPTYSPTPGPSPAPGPAPSGGGGGSISITPPKEEAVKVETVWKDVDPKRYYYDALQWAFDENIIDGVSANKFGIGNNITRAEFFNALYKAVGSPEVASSATTPFTDIAKTASYYKAIVWAVKEGLTNGAGAADVFAPNMKLDRAQIVTILWRYSGSKVQEGKIAFTDVEQGRYYTKAVDWATANGIINGTGDGTTFSPTELMLKESAVTMLYRKFVKALF